MSEQLESDRVAQLVNSHNLRMNLIDPRVAPAPSLAEDRLFITSGENGDCAAGRIQEQCYEESTYAALWGALRRHILHIRVAGPDPASAFDEVVGKLLDQIDTGPRWGADQAVLLTWPSLDLACAAPLVHHGFAPLTSLVVKELRQRTNPPVGATVRSAQSADLDWLADQALWLHRWETQLGVLPERPALRSRLRAELAEAISSETCFVLIASIDQAPVGFIHGQLAHGAWIERQIAMEPAGYLSRLFVEPTARRKSVGRSLIAVAHSVLREHGANAVLLHHSVHNPLAAPMWAKLGYRPILTTWTKRPPQAR